jgi:hypothetical protein
MEDILDVYQRPYNPLRPMVCIDETNKQLVKQTRLPCASGQPQRVDYEYERMGVVDVFMIFEPLAGRRELFVTKTRTAVDFARALKYTSDVMYPSVERIVLVTDNLNTHKPGALCEVFCVEEAHRLLNRFEWYYTPNYGSWLDMAEIEIGVVCRQALGVSIAGMASFENQVRVWTQQCNNKCVKVNWQFTTKDARIKLKRLYLTIL